MEKNSHLEIITEDNLDSSNLELALEELERSCSPIIRSSRNKIPMKLYLVKSYTNFSCAFLTKIIVESVPKNSNEAIESEKWKKAMDE